LNLPTRMPDCWLQFGTHLQGVASGHFS